MGEKVKQRGDWGAEGVKDGQTPNEEEREGRGSEHHAWHVCVRHKG